MAVTTTQTAQENPVKPDLDRFEKFMAAHTDESAPSSLSEIFTGSAQIVASSLDYDAAIPSQEEFLKRKSGNYEVYAESAATSTQQNDKEHEKEVEKDRIFKAWGNTIRAQVLKYNGMELSYDDVTSNFRSSMEQQERFLQRDIPRVDSRDFMYVDENGNIVPPNTYGARVVTTLEEKAEIEEAQGVCAGGMTTEEVTLVDGVMVKSDDVILNLAIQERLERTQQALADVENGTVTLEDLPEDLKQDIVDIQEDGELEIVAEDTGPGILGTLQQEQARNELVQNYRNGSPVTAPLPALGM